MFGGAAGGGKSQALLAEAWTCMRETPGAQGVLLRKSFPELERSLILKSRSFFPRGLCKYNEMTHRWTIATEGRDSTLDFAYCKNAQEAEELYKSAEFTFLGIDELTHNDWDTVAFLISRARTSIPGLKPRIVFASNPGSIGGAWVKEYFGIGKTIPDIAYTPKPTPEDQMPMSRCFIPAKLQDNPHLIKNDPDYVKRLWLLPEQKRKMLLDGDWTVFEGRFFPEFSRARHIVRPFDIPKHWKRVRAIDYGYSLPFCCLWFAVSPSGHIFCYREMYQAGIKDREQAQMIKAASGGESIEYTCGDPSMYIKDSNGYSPADNYLQGAGIVVFPSKNERVAGWMAVRNLLSNHTDGTPVLQFFETSKNTIAQLENVVCDVKNPDDIQLRTRSDHAVDALRYFATSTPTAPKEIENDPYAHLDEASRREWMAQDKKIKEMGGSNEAILRGINSEGDDSFFS